MPTNYADLAGRLDRATRSPLLGFVLGTGLAVVLWAAIGWTAVALLG